MTVNARQRGRTLQPPLRDPLLLAAPAQRVDLEAVSKAMDPPERVF
jgi:hypothetical protein